jgi:hypothetical protein
MKGKGEKNVYIVLIVAMVVVIVASLRMDQFASKLIPLTVGTLTLIMASIGLLGEIRKRQSADAAGSELAAGDAFVEAAWARQLANMAWVLGFGGGIYLVGFLAAIPLFLLSYMTWLGVRWRASLITAVSTTAVSYYLFQVTMHVDFYPGLIFIWLDG